MAARDPAFGPAAVREAVRRHLGAPPDAVRPLPGFVGNHNFSVRTAAGEYVVKAAAGDAVVIQEWVSHRVRRAGVPAPAVVAVDLDCDVLPLPFLVTERVPGAPVADGDGAAVEAGRLLRALHEVDMEGYGYLRLPGTDGPGVPVGAQPTWADFLAEPLSRLDAVVGRGLVDQALADRLRRTVEEHLPLVAGIHQGALLHADLCPDHVYSRNGRVTGIIDWGDAAAGDPLFDLGVWADSAPLDLLLRGYDADPDPDLHRKLAYYRLVWNVSILADDAAATTSWFAEHVQGVPHVLDLFECASR